MGELAVPDLEGRHRVRVLVDGAANSPFDLGMLRIDRTPPVASFACLTPEGGPIVADWMQSDALSGTDPAQPTVVEVNADPPPGRTGPGYPSRSSPSRATGAGLRAPTSPACPTASIWCACTCATAPET